MRRGTRLRRGERPDFVLNMDDVFTLFELARILDPDKFLDPESKAIIYRAKTMDVGSHVSIRVVP